MAWPELSPRDKAFKEAGLSFVVDHEDPSTMQIVKEGGVTSLKWRDAKNIVGFERQIDDEQLLKIKPFV